MGIDKRAIARLMGDIQSEFDKHPIKVPIQADGGEVAMPGTSHFHGPVIVIGQGGHAQVAWDNQTVTQTQNTGDDIAPGFEAIATAVAQAIQALPGLGLSEEDAEQVDATAREVLGEVTQPKPDRTRVKRGVTMLRGLLTPALVGASAGVSEETQALTVHLLEQLSQTF